MRRSRLIWLTLMARWRSQLGVLLGTTIATMVLTGALVIGDSVQGTLREQARIRIGRVDTMLHGGDRFLRVDLASALSDRTGAVVAPVVHVRGIVSTSDGGRTANQVNIYGVDARFFELAPGGDAPPPQMAVLANSTLSHRLDLKPGDEVVVRVELPSAMPRDAVLGDRRETLRGWRVAVSEQTTDDTFDRFGLHADARTPATLFMPITALQEELELGSRANLLLIGETDRRDLEGALTDLFDLSDAQLTIRSTADDADAELISERIFVEPIVESLTDTVEGPRLGVLTYFVNSIEHDGHSTPYSMVSAIGPLDSTGSDLAVDPIPADLADDEIIVNEWLAADLSCEVGDQITLTAFVLDESGRLIESSSSYAVRAIVPMTAVASDRTLMPDFPGIAEAESSSDWEPGIPIDLGRIRDKDEAYWETHRGTPKAFITLDAAQTAWGSRYGRLTAIRFPGATIPTLRSTLEADLDHARVGFPIHDVRTSAMAAGRSTTDFGGLFLGLSLFLIASALGLTALLFVFTVEQRATEIGALRAIGYRRRAIRSLLMREGMMIALVSAMIGALASVPYTWLILSALRGIWSDAIASSAIELTVRPFTLIVGAIATILMSVIAMRLALRGPLRRDPVALLNGDVGSDAIQRRRWPRWSVMIAGVAVLAAGSLAGLGSVTDQATLVFFGAGSALLIGGIAATRAWFVIIGRRATAVTVGLRGLAVRSASRQLNRSVMASSLLACGTFLVLSMAVHQLDAAGDATDRSSGTGGFALIGESTMRVHIDPNEQRGRDAFGLTDDDMADTTFVPFRVRSGEEASCLNLNSAQAPRLAGVRPSLLSERDAFRFVRTAKDVDGSGWDLLDAPRTDGAIPAIGDHASVTWALHKSVGDRLEYIDEHGRPVEVVIVGTVANSILQGNLVIADTHFRRLFPSEDGYRMFLVDSPPSRHAAVEERLERAMSDVGLDLERTVDRLAEYNAVQNTYLSIFQLLGGFGVLLGTVGLGVVVARNVLERRRELAVMRAVGWSTRAVRRLVLQEHVVVLACGLLIGIVAAAVAVGPSVVSGRSGFPTVFVGVMAMVLIVNGLVWIALAARLVVTGTMLDALRTPD